MFAMADVSAGEVIMTEVPVTTGRAADSTFDTMFRLIALALQVHCAVRAGVM
jgi:hypothetical protein